MPKRRKALRIPPRIDRTFVVGRVRALVFHPLFRFLTIAGNGVMLLGAGLLYAIEKGINPDIQSFLDTLWWSVATVTTVGYGDVSPKTAIGKIGGMFLMVFGTALFSSFTALFATILLEPDLEEMEDEVRELEESLHGEKLNSPS